MAMSETVDAEFFALEVLMAWLAFNQEFGNTPEELARLEKCQWHKGELVFDELQKKLNIPPGDPFTVAKAIGDYLTKVGFAKFEIHKVSNTELWRDWSGMIMRPLAPQLRPRGLKVTPSPAAVLFRAALTKLCNVKLESSPAPQDVQASLPVGIERELWRLSPLS